MNIQIYAKWLHDNIGAALAYIAPIIAPLPSAIAVYSVTGSLWTAIALETLGFASVSVVLRTYSRNLKHKAAPLPMWAPIAGFGVYFVAVMWTVITAEVLPAWAIYHTEPAADTFQYFMRSFRVAFLPLLTVVGAMAYGWSAMLDAEEIEETQRRANRTKSSQRRPKVVPTPSQRGQTTTSETVGTDDKMGRIRDAVGTNPFASLAQIHQITGIPKSTVQRELANAGYKKNGNGWEQKDGDSPRPR